MLPAYRTELVRKLLKEGSVYRMLLFPTVGLCSSLQSGGGIPLGRLWFLAATSCRLSLLPSRMNSASRKRGLEQHS
ncbi:unnamed protein product [Arctogadus glacialis]